MSNSKEKNSRYSIGEVSDQLNLPIETLRFYEKSGVIGNIDRDINGRRIYSDNDKKWLGFVNCLKSTGMPLNKIRLYNELMAKGDETAIERRTIIVTHQKVLQIQMEEIQTALDRINHKVEFYDELIESHGLN